MALGLSATVSNDFLEWLFNASATSTAPTNIYIQLHTADPGQWRWDIGGPDSYPDRRLLIAPQDVSRFMPVMA